MAHHKGIIFTRHWFPFAQVSWIDNEGLDYYWMIVVGIKLLLQMTRGFDPTARPSVIFNHHVENAHGLVGLLSWIKCSETSITTIHSICSTGQRALTNDYSWTSGGQIGRNEISVICGLRPYSRLYLL